MAYAHGKRTTMTIGGNSFPFRLSNADQQSANAETTNYLTSGDFDSIDGVKSVTIAGDVLFDPTTAYLGGTSAGVFVEGLAVSGTLAVSDGTATKTLGFTVRWDSINVGADVNDAVKISVSGKGKISSRWA